MLLSTLDSFLNVSEYFAGDELTVADFAFLASVGSIKVTFSSIFTIVINFYKFQCWGVNFKEFPKLNAWFEKCKALPGFGENHEGSQLLADKLTKNLDEALWR